MRCMALREEHWLMPYHAISSFTNLNDAPETTHADVLAAFDKAIAIAEGAQ